MRLEDMNILEKASELEALIAKADSEPDYSIEVKWVGNQSDAKKEAKKVIENTRTLFASGGVDAFDMEVRAETYATFNTRLDSFLKMFPEYKLNDVITESINPRHM